MPDSSLVRAQKLRKNFRIMFFVQALIHFKMINIVVSIFYIYRGLSLAQIFYLSIVWSLVGLFFEIPSSYMADQWGRKKTIIIGTVSYFLNGVVAIFAHSFLFFGISMFLWGFSFACISGTDDALICDTNRELNGEKSSLQKLGHYYSAQQIFKIVTPLIAALIAKDLAGWQFVVLLIIDSLAALVAIFLSLTLTEPNRYVDTEKIEAGIIIDAANILRKNKLLAFVVFNRSLVFISMLLIWRYYQTMFVDLGLSVIALGIAGTILPLTVFMANRYSDKILNSLSASQIVNYLNRLFFISFLIFVILWYFYPNSYLLLACYIIGLAAEAIRWPYFSHIFNIHSYSYNRATTLSLSNLVKNVLDIPLLLIGAYLVEKSYVYPYFVLLGLSLIAIIFFRLPKNIKVSPEKVYNI